MIGGIDIEIPHHAGENASEVVVRTIRLQWPLAAFENGLTGDRYGRYPEIPFRQIEELFIYRDNQVADQWDAEGAVAALCNTMIHLITEPDLVTLVIDERTEEMMRMVASIRFALQDSSRFIPAEVRKEAA